MKKMFVTLRHPKMHLHTKFGIPISKNIGDMHQFLETRSKGQVQGHSDLIMVCVCHPKMHPHTKFEIPKIQKF